MAGSDAERMFNYVKPNVLPDGGTIYIPAAPHPRQHLPLSSYLILAT